VPQNRLAALQSGCDEARQAKITVQKAEVGNQRTGTVDVQEPSLSFFAKQL
jgi:hypothetical protein